ncbi:metallophosphoesterase [Chromatiaceae bacterium AAb-1]|nr:metallophosphoesterase [Chromatiaceae bacterium AAb-1]
MARWILSFITLLTIVFYLWCFSPGFTSTQDYSILFRGNTVQAATTTSELDDGPYAFFSDAAQQVDLKWVCDNQVIYKQQPVTSTIKAVCAYSKDITLQVQHTVAPELKYTAEQVAVISDIHGQFRIMTELLQANGITDDNLNWSFGDGHLVIAGDVMDRGDKVTESLWLLYQLEQQAEQAGGKVHLLLGNHETMVFYNDLRYINKKYAQVAAMLGTDYSGLFAEDSVLGQWLRTKPVLVQVNDMLFMHGGLHPDYLALGMSMAEVNEQYRQSLGIAREKLRDVPVLNFLYGSLGPLWYRGYFRPENAITEPLLEQLLTTLNVSRIVVGHTSMEGVFSHFGGRVISVDSNIKRGTSGEILLWNAGVLQRGTLSGERLPMRPLPATIGH